MSNKSKMDKSIHFHHIKKNEISLFVRAFTDLESGNHLCCKRSPEQISAINEVCDVLDKDESNRTGRYEEILFLEKLCTDYYWCVDNGYENLNFEEIETDE